MVKLKDICIINPKSPVLADELPVSFVPMPKVGENGEFDPSDIKPYHEVKKGFTSFQEGDVLFAKITPCMENGKGAVARYLLNGYGFGSTEFHVLRPNPALVTSEWLYYLTRRHEFRKDAERNMTGSAGQKRVPKTFLENYEINLPSLSVQHEQTKSLNLIGNLIDLRQEQLAKLDELVKARFVEMFGDPETNLFGWVKVTVQQAVEQGIIDKPLDGNHGGKHPKTSDYVPTGVPFIMANNLVDGNVDLINCAFISKKQADSLDKGFAHDGDVLITHKGTIGRTAIVHCQHPYIMLTPQVTYYRPLKGITAEYLKAYFDTDYFQKIIANIASIGSTRAYIGITAQQELPLMIPSMEKQLEYAAFTEQANKTKLTIQASLDKLEVMKKALMQEYFG